MSGITPLLDTLLHQVLGKRVDTAEPRELNQPVRPTAPSDAPRALHSDSRLDARRNIAAPQEAGRARQPPGDPPAARGKAAPEAPPASTQTRLSGAGRAISELLTRFPAPPSILTLRTPLVAASQPLAPDALAARLESSIRNSGLFYESHLSRWYRGELPRQQLESEPQMWRPLRFTPARAQGESGALTQRAPLVPSHRSQLPPDAASLRDSAPAPLHSRPPPAAAQESSSVASSAPAAKFAPLPARPERAPPPDGSRPVHESLQGIVRHQLEMLVAPALRWEGDVWSGLFMALMILPPPDERTPEDEAESAEQETQGRAWRSEIDLDIAGTGRLQASLWMRAEQLKITLRVSEHGVYQRLKDDADTLQARLSGHGFSHVDIDLGILKEGPPDGQG
ncbi:MAG TPA: flagellar hook-length control protein FliK [Halomonas sp.]|nr:flagellar hook-length control protein FliK [Halomonas sp.]